MRLRAIRAGVIPRGRLQLPQGMPTMGGPYWAAALWNQSSSVYSLMWIGAFNCAANSDIDRLQVNANA